MGEDDRDDKRLPRNREAITMAAHDVSPAPRITPVPPAPARPLVPTTVSTRPYWAGGGVIAAAAIGAVAWVVLAWFGFTHHIAEFPRVTVPGATTVIVGDTSTRVLYYEGARGRPPIPVTDITVIQADGVTAPVEVYRRDLRYDVPGDSSRVGTAIGSFRPALPGTYTIVVTTGTPGGRVAIGDDAVWNAVPHVLGAGAVFLVGAGIGLAMIVRAAVRRSPARR